MSLETDVDDFFTYHHDSGHGWLEVTREEIQGLGLEDKISSCSYIRRGKAYLEEDVDARLFLSAFMEKFGFMPEVKEVQIDGMSEIRDYDLYTPEWAKRK